MDITSDMFTYQEERYFTRVGRYIDLDVSPMSNTEIPPRSSFEWDVQIPRQSNVVIEGDRMLPYNFPVWGEYTIAVRGTYAKRRSFSGFINIFALSKPPWPHTISNCSDNVLAANKLVLSCH